MKRLTLKTSEITIYAVLYRISGDILYLITSFFEILFYKNVPV